MTVVFEHWCYVLTTNEFPLFLTFYLNNFLFKGDDMFKATVSLSLDIKEGRITNHTLAGENYKINNEVSRVVVEAVENLLASYRPIKVEPEEYVEYDGGQ